MIVELQEMMGEMKLKQAALHQQQQRLGFYLDEAIVRGAPTQNWLPLLSLGGQERADFAPAFGGKRAGSEIDIEYS